MSGTALTAKSVLICGYDHTPGAATCGVVQLVSRGGCAHVGGHFDVEDEGLLDVPFPGVHADDRAETDRPGAKPCPSR